MDGRNPITVAVWFFAVVSVTMFCSNPILTSLSFLAALSYDVFTFRAKSRKIHFLFVCLILVMTLINPLLSHNGATVLFVMNDLPVTWESLVYGFFAALMLVGTFYWFRAFTRIMTSDKLLYLFGKLSPKLALVLSMCLRYVPLFCRKAKQIEDAQQAVGLYASENLAETIRGKCRVVSILMTWGLENGIWTADSMTARGYGTAHRSHFSILSLRCLDWVLLVLCIVLFGIIVYTVPDFTFYPEIQIPEFTLKTVLCISSFVVLLLLPFLLEFAQASARKQRTMFQDRIPYEKLFND